MSDTQDLTQHKEQLLQGISLKNAVLKLSENADFNKIIIEGFCKNYMLDQLEASINPIIDVSARDSALRMAQAGGLLTQYLRLLVASGVAMENELKNIEFEESHYGNGDVDNA